MYGGKRILKFRCVELVENYLDFLEIGELFWLIFGQYFRYHELISRAIEFIRV